MENAPIIDTHSIVETLVVETSPNKALGTIKLFGILFISVVGGAYGAEPLVQSVGPLLAIIILVVCSLAVMLPICLITAELSTSLPSNGGLVDWVTCATSPFANFFTMFITTISLIGATIDNAVYPTLFCGYLEQMVPLPWWAEVLVKLGVTIIATGLNLVGIDIIGRISVLFTLATLFPFVVFCGFGVFSTDVHWDNLLAIQQPAQMNWPLLISVLFWNINGVDGCGNISEDVRKVERTIPRAMLLLVLATICAYVFPCAVGSILDDNWPLWVEGSFVDISSRISVHWVAVSLPWLMFFGGLASSLGYLLTLMCTASRLFHGFVMLDFHPLITRTIGHVNTCFKTPDVCIILQGIVVFVFSACLPFSDLVGVDSAFYAIRVFFIALSFILLRVRYPDLPRPFKFGPNIVVALLFATPTIVFCICCAILGLMSSLWTVIIGGVLLHIVIIVSLIFFWFFPRNFTVHDNIVALVKSRDLGPAEGFPQDYKNSSHSSFERIPSPDITVAVESVPET